MTIYLQYLPPVPATPKSFQKFQEPLRGGLCNIRNTPTATMDPMFQPAFLLFQQKKQQGSHEMKVMFFFWGGGSWHFAELA